MKRQQPNPYPLPTMPHCDPSVLHSNGSCEFCDLHPEWQQYREMAGINFTGEDDPNKAPCPSSHFRSPASVDAWYGNRASVPAEVIWAEYRRLKEEIERRGLFPQEEER